MSEDEIAIMDGGKCILQLRGVRPFFSEKFDITKHPHYKYLADADKKNTLLRRFPVIEVTMTGFCMRMDAPARGLSPGRLFWLAAAGPAVNFMLAGIWALRLEQELTIRGSAFWAANLLTGGFNLLPVPPLDGAQLASCLCEMRRAGKKFKGND